MRIEANTRVFGVQLIVVNAFVLIIGLTAYFVANAVLVPALSSFLIFNAAWYVFIYRRKRVVALLWQDEKEQLSLDYNGDYEAETILLEKLELAFEQVRGQNDNDVTILAIYDGEKRVDQIRPGMTGFSPVDLEGLMKKYEAYNGANSR